MSRSGETWNQWMLSHRPLSRFFQIDRLVAVFAGAGSSVTPAFGLPHGRYTVYIHIDRDHAGRSFKLIADGDVRLQDDLRPWGTLAAPLVQTEVPKGTYRVAIEVSSKSACWKMQVVLNSMLSWEAMPRPWQRTLALPSAITVANDTSPGFAIQQTGHYAVALDVDGFMPDQRVFPKEFCPFKLGLRAQDGHRLELAHGGGNTASWPPTPIFLGAGAWTVEMQTTCEWWMTIKPMLGASGGGAHWF